MSKGRPPTPPAASRKPPRKVSLPRLRRIAAHYLERFDAPPGHLRLVLLRRARRDAAHHDQPIDDVTAWVDQVVGELTQVGLVDDARYAANALRRLRDRGQPTRKIRAALAVKRVPGEVVSQALADEAEEADDGPAPDWVAALRYARRRSFGPWRRPTPDPEKPRKELASMVRAGFPYEIARRITHADDPDAVREELPTGW